MSLKPRHPDAKVSSAQDRHKLPQSAFDEVNPHRTLTSWERAELREACQAEGIEYPGNTLSDFIRVTGRKPEAI